VQGACWFGALHGACRSSGRSCRIPSSGPIRGLIAWIQQDQQPGALEFVEASPGFSLSTGLGLSVSFRARAASSAVIPPGCRAGSTRCRAPDPGAAACLIVKDLEGANLGRGLLEVMLAHDRIARLTIEQDHRSRPEVSQVGQRPPASRRNLQRGILCTPWIRFLKTLASAPTASSRPPNGHT
jgi:hypothetical protein